MSGPTTSLICTLHLRAQVAASPDDLLNLYDLETASRWDAGPRDGGQLVTERQVSEKIRLRSE
jgi:hypothetical protein